MQFKFVATFAGLLLLSSGSCNPVDVTPAPTMICNADNVLRALRRFSSEAIPFCSDYIGLPKATVTVATITPTLTATITSFVQSPNVDKRAAETLIARGSDVIFGLAPVIVERDFVALPTYVSQYPASRVSSACSCLTIPLATESVTSTAPAQVTTVTTIVPTDLRGDCKTTYNTSGNGSGNRVDVVSASSASDCCLQCQAKKNCVANAYLATSYCQHLINDYSVGGETITDKCPLGVENYHFGSASPGLVYAGPCGV